MKTQFRNYLAMASLAILASNPCSAATVVSTAFQTGASPLDPTWNSSIASGDLLFGISPASSTGTYANETPGVLSVLTDGTSGIYTATKDNMVAPSDGAVLTYNLASATQLLAIGVYGGWSDSGRAHLDYSVSYSTDGVNYFSLSSVDYNPVSSGNPVALQSIISDDTAYLAGGAAITNLRFTFAGGTYFGYSEIAAYGDAVPEPSTYALLGAGMLGLFVLRRKNLSS